MAAAGIEEGRELDGGGRARNKEWARHRGDVDDVEQRTGVGSGDAAVLSGVRPASQIGDDRGIDAGTDGGAQLAHDDALGLARGLPQELIRQHDEAGDLAPRHIDVVQGELMDWDRIAAADLAGVGRAGHHQADVSPSGTLTIRLAPIAAAKAELNRRLSRERAEDQPGALELIGPSSRGAAAAGGDRGLLDHLGDARVDAARRQVAGLPFEIMRARQ